MTLLDAVFGYAPAQIVHVAARLGLADQLADGPRTSEDLALATGTHAPTLHRLLRGLASLGAVAQRDTGWELTEEGRVLRSDQPDSVRRMIMLSVSDEVWRSWGELEYSVRTGRSAWHKVTGQSSFAYFAEHPEQRGVFNDAMSQHTRTVAPEFTRGYDFTRFATLVDLGGGNGTLISAFLKAVPTLRGILLDTEDGLEDAPKVLAEEGVADRCELVTGDFFQAVPPNADAYTIKSVIHDWDDEQTVAIYRTVRAAMGEHSVLITIEPVLPERVNGKEHAGPVMSDLNMLVLTEGRERTEREYRDLYRRAGLTVSEVVGPLAGYRLIVGAPSTSSTE